MRYPDSIHNQHGRLRVAKSVTCLGGPSEEGMDLSTKDVCLLATGRASCKVFALCMPAVRQNIVPRIKITSAK